MATIAAKSTTMTSTASTTPHAMTTKVSSHPSGTASAGPAAVANLRRGDAVEVLLDNQDGKYRAIFWAIAVLQCLEKDRALVLTVRSLLFRHIT